MRRLSLARRLAALSVALLTLFACSSAGDVSSSEDENGTRGPAAIHPGWFKTPEAMSETIARTWKIELSPDEEQRTLGGMRASLGGVSVANQGSLLDRPNELYVLSVHSLSEVVADKLLERQAAMAAIGEPYLFEGLGFSGEDDGCYADDARAYCDGVDGLQIGSLTAMGVDAAAPSRELRKRLMHKVQSIGEFFLLAIDERTAMPGTPHPHAPAYLVDEVFLPKLREAALSPEQERLAWREVVVTILLSGYYLDLPADP